MLPVLAVLFALETLLYCTEEEPIEEAPQLLWGFHTPHKEGRIVGLHLKGSKKHGTGTPSLAHPPTPPDGSRADRRQRRRRTRRTAKPEVSSRLRLRHRGSSSDGDGLSEGPAHLALPSVRPCRAPPAKPFRLSFKLSALTPVAGLLCIFRQRVNAQPPEGFPEVKAFAALRGDSDIFSLVLAASG